MSQRREKLNVTLAQLNLHRLKLKQLFEEERAGRAKKNNVVSVSVRFRNKERETRLKDREKWRDKKKEGEGVGKKGEETFAGKPRDFENRPLCLSCLSARTYI